MKKITILPLICLGINLLPAMAFSAQTPSKVLLAQIAQQTNAQKIAQVKDGTLKIAKASWWGFDPADATDCLQKAINSGASEIIVDNMGSDWIISKPLQLVSNQQIIFQDGVVIQAKKNAFKGKNDVLFNGEKLTNVSLLGEGNVIFRMQRTDYANPKLYEKAEWRHGIALWECSNVILRNITVTETGGDGLYLGAKSSGYNKNILVDNMTFDANYRQGISVISAEDLTIRNCKLNNTSGTAPQAGIDFEPNQRSQRLVNCIIENCEITGNKGSGVEIALMRSDHTTPPISVTVKSTFIKGNSAGLAVNPSGKNIKNPVQGKVLLENCTLVGDRITLSNPTDGAIQYIFKDTTIDFTHQNDPKTANWQIPISMSAENPADGRPIGDVRFDDVTILGNIKNPIALPYTGKATVADSITGGIVIKNEGIVQRYDVARFVKDKQAEFSKFNQLIPAKLDIEKLQIPTGSEPRDGNGQFYLRGEFTFLQYAQAGETLRIDVGSRRIYPRKATIQLLDPSGKEMEIYDIPAKSGHFSIEFTAKETGFYELVRRGESSNYTDINSPYPGNGLTTFKDEIQFLPKSGYLYFEVPAGVNTFSIGVTGSPEADVALVNPQGEEVERVAKLGSMHLFSAARQDNHKSEIWALRVRSAVWAINVKPYAPLTSIFSTNPSTMLRQK